jgi:uncharacterized membrane protein YkvA (DUF1232 family)
LKRKKGTELAKRTKESRAFGKALERARAYAKNPRALRELFEKATRRMALLPKAPFAELWAYFQAMLRLIRAYYRGHYRNVSAANFALIVGAIIYVLDPWDLVPDWIPGLGFLDDATILAFAVQRTRETLEDFMNWEKTAR